MGALLQGTAVTQVCGSLLEPWAKDAGWKGTVATQVWPRKGCPPQKPWLMRAGMQGTMTTQVCGLQLKEYWKKGCCGYPSQNRKRMSSAGTMINGSWTARNSGDSNLWSWSPGSNGFPSLLLGANVPSEAMCHGGYNAGSMYESSLLNQERSSAGSRMECWRKGSSVSPSWMK